MRSASMMWLVVLGVHVVACGDDEGALLIVDLRTDFVLGAELDTLELLSVRGPEAVSVRAQPTGDGLEGVRVADLEGVPPGTYHLAALASRPDGTLLARTEFILEVKGTTTARVLMTRDCAGVTCPADDPTLSACLGGRCEDPRCVAGDADACVSSPACGADGDCRQDELACGTVRCLEGRCVVETDDGGCGTGTYCAPETGCLPVMPAADAGPVGTDAATDGGTPDAGVVDGGTVSVTDPTCRNGMRDGDEAGVDCGGGCTACAEDICGVQTDIPQAECLALVALYEATDGPRWRGQSGWATPTSPCTWSDVTCEGGHVVVVDVQGSNLGGTLPAELANLTELRELDVRLNRINGTIPPELGSLETLEELYLDENALVGSIPASLGDLTNLRNLRANTNALTGEIPSSLGNLTSLRDLRLFSNRLHGPVPVELGALPSLLRLELHGNGLEGTIPASLGTLPLTLLKLSHNRLEGEVPRSFLDLDDTIADLALQSNDCLTSSDPELTAWLDAHNPNWSDPNATVDCP